MVEIVTFTGITLTLPGILSAAYSVLKAAYDIYGEVDMRRMQMRVLLDRCADLIVKLSRYLSQPGTQPSARITLGISNLEETCEAVRAVIEKLKQKGFLWCMVNQDKIDVEFSYVEYKIADAFALFNFLAHMGNDELQQQLQRARNYDRVQLNDKLDDLCSNDHRILGALMDQGGTQRRMEGILVDVLKCVRELGPEQTPKSRFLRSASAVLQRMSKGRKPDVSEDWIISGLDVDFEPTDAIGQGSFGRVFKGRWKAARVAIKQMYVDDARSLSEADRKMMYREAHLWSKLHHPNILHLYGACLEAATPFFVMQYCSLGNLCNYLVDYPDANRVNLAYDIAAGVTYLHGRNIVHADLKGVNILVDNKHTALVTDFGLSTAIDGIRSRSTHSRRAGARHGTLQWMAPEVLNGDKPTMASDIYSLALTIWEVFSGEIPFEGVNDNVLWLLIVNQERRPERPDRLIEDAIWDIMRQCWAASPFLRPSIQKVLMSISKFSTRLGSVAHDVPSLQIAAPSTYSVDAGTFSSALSQMSVSTARPPAPMPSREENGASSAESSRPTYSPEPFVSPLASDPDIAVSRDVLGQEGGDSTLSALTRAPEAGSPFEYAAPRSDSTFSQCDPPVEISPPLPPDPQDAAPVLLAPSSSMESSQHDALRRLVLPPLQIPSPEPSNDSPLSPPPSTSPKAKQFASPSRLSPLRELARSLAHDFQEKREQRRSGGFWEQWTPGGRDDRRSASYSPAGQESLLSQMIHILAASSVEEFSLSIALDVAERASANETNATEAVRALGTEFKSGDVLRQLSAAKLWAIMLRDASDIFLRQCMSRKFVDAIDDTLINHAASPVVKERLLTVLASAAYESARRKPNGESGFDGLQSLWRKFKPVGKPDEGFPLENDDPIYYVPKGRRLSVEPGPQLEATPTPVSRPPSPPADSPVESLAETLAGAQVSGMLARYLDEQSCIPSSAWEAKRPSEGSSGSLLRGPRQPGNSSGGRGREGGVSRSVSNTAVLNDPQELPQGLGELLTQNTGPEHSRAVEDQMLTYLRRSNEILAMLLRSNGQNNDSSSPSAPPPYPG